MWPVAVALPSALAHWRCQGGLWERGCLGTARKAQRTWIEVGWRPALDVVELFLSSGFHASRHRGRWRGVWWNPCVCLCAHDAFFFLFFFLFFLLARMLFSSVCCVRSYTCGMEILKKYFPFCLYSEVLNGWWWIIMSQRVTRKVEIAVLKVKVIVGVWIMT